MSLPAAVGFVCPGCAVSLAAASPDVLACHRCDRQFAYHDRIHRFLLPARRLEIEPFVRQYRHVRAREGYRQSSPDYYRSLPSVDRHHPHARIWQLRRESHARLLDAVLPSMGRGPHLILELGAGNGWLSHRLSLRGHRCVAVDWLDDAEDGLGACRHYPTEITCVQADYDQLPLGPAQFDLVVFNGSLHYASDVRRTLASAMRLTRPGGIVLAMDSPIFRTRAAGRRMVEEAERHLETDYGLTQVVRPGVGYLTTADLETAARDLGLTWRLHPIRGGAWWIARRLIGRLRTRREVARFGLWIATRPPAS